MYFRSKLQEQKLVSATDYFFLKVNCDLFSRNSDFKTSNCEFILRNSKQKSELWDKKSQLTIFIFNSVVETSFHV